ncbi:MAG TPA: hypothetical protein VMT83_03005 [Burkholderiaceae bacterium]|nr:hypothetical protein [Burkholderiaceae bacterium]
MNPDDDVSNPIRRDVLRVATVAALGAFAAAWLTLAAPAACAANTAGFEAAFATFQRAAAGDDGAIEPAATQFAGLSQAEPADPLLLAYSGAATAMRARAAVLPWKKMSLADEGLARIDKALAMLQPGHDAQLHRGTPTALETRFVAANTFLGMPAMFNRGARGRSLLEQVLASPQFAASPLSFRGTVWLRAGIAAAADNRPIDARRWFEQVVSSGAPQAGAAQAKLKELSS